MRISLGEAVKKKESDEGRKKTLIWKGMKEGRMNG